jgi:hypothetical protein
MNLWEGPGVNPADPRCANRRITNGFNATNYDDDTSQR